MRVSVVFIILCQGGIVDEFRKPPYVLQGWVQTVLPPKTFSWLKEKNCHINVIKLKAVYLGLKS